jgi:hypothetical protein
VILYRNDVCKLLFKNAQLCLDPSKKKTWPSWAILLYDWKNILKEFCLKLQDPVICNLEQIIYVRFSTLIWISFGEELDN